MITPAQCIEARKLLNWSRYRLAARYGRSWSFIRAFEIGKRNLPPEDLAAIQRALEEAGVEFTSGDEPNVKLKQSART